MSALAHSDTFFVIAGICLILITAVLLAGLTYLLLIFRSIKNVLSAVRKQTDLIAEDIDGLRTKVKEEGVRTSHLVGFITSLYKRRHK